MRREAPEEWLLRVPPGQKVRETAACTLPAGQRTGGSMKAE